MARPVPKDLSQKLSTGCLNLQEQVDTAGVQGVITPLDTLSVFDIDQLRWLKIAHYLHAYA